MKTLWNNLPIRSKLLVSIGAILVIFAITLAIDFAFLGQQIATINFTANQLRPLSESARTRRVTLVDADDAAMYTFVDNHKANTAGYLKRYDTDMAAISKELQSLGARRR